MPAGKEAMTLSDFDEADYITNLVDKEGYSAETAKMMAKKKKESLEAKKIEIDLGSLVKAKDDDEEFEHLSPEERKKRQEERDKRQKERAAHRIVRQKQHEEIEESISEGK